MIGAASVTGQVLGGVIVQADVLGLGWRALFVLNRDRADKSRRARVAGSDRREA